MQHANGELVAGPPNSYILEVGDRLMMVSNDADVETLDRTGATS